MRTNTIIITTLLFSCRAAAPLHERLGCDGTTGSAGAESTTGSALCEDPTLGGRVLPVGLEDATGDGPIVVFLHGTFESPEGSLAQPGAAAAIRDAVLEEGGVLLLPRGRPWAQDPSDPWPWGAVQGDVQWMGEDDQLVQDAIACVPGDPDRISVSGFSAGAIAASYMGAQHPWASVALWSGGLQPADRPGSADAPAVMAIHGGANDIPQLREGAISYAIYAPQLGVLCDHDGGHVDALGSDGAAFLAYADVDGHPWAVGLPTWTAQHYCEVVP